MKKIKLKCQTGGYKYDDVVDVSDKGTITPEIAKGLIADGLAIHLKDFDDVDETEAESDTTEKVATSKKRKGK